MSTNRLNASIRWALRRDRETILEIDRLSFRFPWPADMFQYLAGDRDITFQVVCDAAMERPMGFMVMRLERRRLSILRFAVHPDARGYGLGRDLIGYAFHLARDASHGKREVRCQVGDHNTPAQTFLRHMGLKCLAMKEIDAPTPFNVYEFCWRVDGSHALLPFQRLDLVV